MSLVLGAPFYINRKNKRHRRTMVSFKHTCETPKTFFVVSIARLKWTINCVFFSAADFPLRVINKLQISNRLLYLHKPDKTCAQDMSSTVWIRLTANLMFFFSSCTSLSVGWFVHRLSSNAIWWQSLCLVCIANTSRNSQTKEQRNENWNAKIMMKQSIKRK